MRSDHLSCYGYERETSPNICELAEDGVLFENAFSHGGFTLPSVSSLLTSKLPPKQGVRSIKNKLNADTKTVLKDLRKKAYKTRFVSDMKPLGNWSFLNLEKDPFFIEILGGDLNWVLEFSNRSEDQFYYMHFFGSHAPYIRPGVTSSKFQSVNEREINSSLGEKLQSTETTTEEKEEILSDLKESERDKIFQYIVDKYDNVVWSHDRALGYFFDELKRSNIYEDSMIIVTADHGESLGSHDIYFTHRNVYENIIRVPLIIKFPGNKYSGRRINSVVRHIDIVPTIYEVLGEQINYSSGVSLLPFLSGEKRDLSVYANYRSVHTLRGSEYKYIYRNVSEELEFLLDMGNYSEKEKRDLEMGIRDRYDPNEKIYNIKEDPNEENNLIFDRPEVREKMREELFRILENSSSEEREMTETLRKKLEELGYM